MIKQITDQTFKQEVLKNDKPILVDFWAPWCGPCKMMGPIIDHLAQELNNIDFAKINVQENQEYANKYQITSIPNLLIFNKGKIVKQLIGAQSPEVLKEELSKIEK